MTPRAAHLPRPFADDARARVSDVALVRLLVGYGLRARGPLVAALLLLPAVVLVPIAGPRLVRRALDVEIAAGDLDGLVTAVGLYLGLALADLLVRLANTYATASIGQRIALDLRRDISDRMLRLPLSFFRRQPMGRLMTRLTSDIESVNEAFAAGAVALVGEAFLLVGIVAAMVHLDAPIAGAALAVMPVLVLFTAWVRSNLRDAHREVRALHAEMNAFAAEAAAGASTIQAVRAEARFDRRFERVNADYFRTVVRMNVFEAAFYTGIQWFGTLSMAAAIGWAGAAAGAPVRAGLLTAMVQYVVLLFVPLRGVANKVATFQQAFAALERIVRLMEEPPESDRRGAAAPPRGPASLRVEGLRFSYREGTEVLKGITLDVPPGGRLAVVGETGAGKSTLARLLLGLYPIGPGGGRILLDGRPLEEVPLGDLRRRVALVPQEPFLFEASLEENLAMGRPVDPARLREIVRDFGLEGLAARFESGAGEGGRRLSEGEKQLVALARLAAGDPGLVVLDEATSALDPATERRVQVALERALAGRTAVVIAHRLSTLERCDRIAVLHHGALAEEGTHADLLARGGLYAMLWRLYALEGRLSATA